MRRRRTSLASSPTMVGALTTLVSCMAVFLAYNANHGLPFVQTYDVSLDVPNAARLHANNEVRIGGHLIGVIDSVEPISPSEAGRSGATATPVTGTTGAVARINLRLDQSVAPLPASSAFRVRYRSAFGTKYLEITPGYGSPVPEGFVFNGTNDGEVASAAGTGGETGAADGVFVKQAEFDDLAGTFDTRTRMALRTNLTGLGDALAGRGRSLNEALTALDPLIRDLQPVAGALAARSTRLGPTIQQLAATARTVAPVAGDQAQLVTNLAQTFDALAADPAAVRDTVSEAAPMLETAVAVLPGQRSFLADLAELARRLEPGSGELRAALPRLNPAVGAGVHTLRRTPEAGKRLEGVLGELRALIEQPSTGVSLRRLAAVLANAEPTLRFVAPVQTVCNYWTYFFTFVPNALSDRDQIGFSLRNNIIQYPLGPQEIGLPFPPPLDRVTLPGQVETGLAGYSGIQANGRAGPIPNPGDAGVFKPYELPILHTPFNSTLGQRDANCTSGQAGYTLGDLRVPGEPVSRATALAPIPGSRGPTTLFLTQNGTKELRDTRVPSRQP